MKELVPITHDDFIVGYQSGRLGCGVNVLRILFLVYSNKIRVKRILIEVVGWSIGLLAVIGVWIVGLFFLPLLLALVAGAVVVAAIAMVCLHRVAETVLATALSDDEFYQSVTVDRALRVAPDVEGNFPRLHKVVPMRDSGRARRR